MNFTKLNQFNTIRKLTDNFCNKLELQGLGHDHRIKVMDVVRTFTETMYSGKYHFSQNTNPIVWSISCDDFNMVLATDGKAIELFNISVATIGQGLGTKILSALLDSADETGTRIKLCAVPTLLIEFLEDYHLNNKTAGPAAFVPIHSELTTATDRLIDYYESIGFKTYGKKFEMVYTPNC